MIHGHGNDTYQYQGKIHSDFSSNIPCHLDNTPLEKHLRTNLHTLLSDYPEPTPHTLQTILARQIGISPTQIMITAGATQAIYLIAQMNGNKPTAILQPTFSEYADAAKLHGAPTTHLTHAQLHRPLPENIHTLWICNPNNPTGTVLPIDTILNLLQNNPHTTLIIDHSYKDFTLQPLITPAQAAEHPNLILIHSLTKRFAIPGLRLGYITAHQTIIRRLQTLQQPWAVNSPAIAAGLFLAPQITTPLPQLPQLLAQTTHLTQQLNNIPHIHAHPTNTHFLLAQTTIRTAAQLKDYLAQKHGLLIRNADNFHGLTPQHFRIATRTPEENRTLVQAITQFTRQ